MATPSPSMDYPGQQATAEKLHPPRTKERKCLDRDATMRCSVNAAHCKGPITAIQFLCAKTPEAQYPRPLCQCSRFSNRKSDLGDNPAPVKAPKRVELCEAINDDRFTIVSIHSTHFFVICFCGVGS